MPNRLGELTTLGSFTLVLSGHGVKNLHQRLVILRLLLEGAHDRRALADLLWPGVAGQRDRSGRELLGTRSLNTALSALAATSSRDPLFGSDSLRSHVWLLNTDTLTCDALLFDQDAKAGRYRQALGRYHGPFLDGFEDAFSQRRLRRHFVEAHELLDWVGAQRTRLRRQRRFVQALAEQGRHEFAPELHRRLRAIDPDALPSCLEWLMQYDFDEPDTLANEAGMELDAQSRDGEIPPSILRRTLLALRLLERHDPDHAVARGTRRLAGALQVDANTLIQTLEELELFGWIGERGRLSAPTIVDRWLEGKGRAARELLASLATADTSDTATRSTMALQEAFEAWGGHYVSPEQLHHLRQSAPPIASELIRTGALGRALQALDRVVDLERHLGLVHDATIGFWLAYTLERMGRFHDAKAALQAVPIEARDDRMQALLGTLLFRLGDPASAEQIADALEPALAIGSWASAQLANLRGNLAHSRGDYAEAIDRFRLAELKWRFLDPNRRVGEVVNVGIAYDWMGNPDSAEIEFRKALELADRSGANDLERLRALYNWSVCLVEHGRYDGFAAVEKKTETMVATMRAEDRYVPDAFEVHYLLSVAIELQEQGEDALARGRFDKASRLAATLGNRTLQGQALFHLGEIESDLVMKRYGLELIEASGSVKDLKEYRQRLTDR